MTRVLVLCTHNSARSQMAEGWLRHHAAGRGLELDVWSAGTERSRVKPGAIAAMAEVGIDLSTHASKRLDEVADPWAFDVVLTVCDAANETCPAYPARTTRLHAAFPDPSGHPLERWREVRDAIGAAMARLADVLAAGRTPTEADVAGGTVAAQPVGLA
ncbi:MAG: arsenate reductase ArsC [Trueperaceae bacterium]|nr:arsenate reductase ArsC [Trueperaceae bacterium]